MSTFSIEYLVTKSPIAPERVGAQSLLVCEARAMNPPVDKHNRSDTKFTGDFESTLLDQWEEIQISVINILHGARDELIPTELSKHLDFKQFFQSAANGQPMTLDATSIGGVDQAHTVKLISTSNELIRKAQRQKFRTTFRLRVVSNA